MFMGIPPPQDPATERTERHLRMLAELAEIGMGLARAAGLRAAAEAAIQLDHWEPEPPPPKPERGPHWEVAFARIARTVQQCVALEARIAAGKAAEAEPWRRDWRAAIATDRRRRMGRMLHEADHADPELDGDPEEQARLIAAIDLRLRDAEAAGALDEGAPVARVVEAICEDLGVTLESEPPEPDEPDPPPPLTSRWRLQRPNPAPWAVPWRAPADDPESTRQTPAGARDPP